MEQRDPNQLFFALAQALAALRPADAGSCARHLVAKLDEFRGPFAISDDLTVITAFMRAS